MGKLSICSKYVEAVRDAQSFLFRCAFKEYIPSVSVEDVQKYDARLLRLNINAVFNEIMTSNLPIEQAEMVFDDLINDPHDTSYWMDAERSIYYDENKIIDRLISEGYNEEQVSFFLSQIYKLQCSVMERIQSVRELFNFSFSKDNGVTTIDTDKLKPYFKKGFFGGMGENKWISFEYDIKKPRKAIDFGRIAEMIYHSRWRNRDRMPNTFLAFLKEFEDIVGHHVSDSQRKESKLKPTPSLEKEFSYLL